MSTGLYIRQKKSLHLGIWAFWSIFFFLCGATMWYGYRFYIAGELPPVPIPVATARTDVEETPVAPEKKQEHTVSPLHPRFISIPSLGISNARVLGVGVRANGEVDTPHNIHDTGWYTKSSLPGEDFGAVLIDGHNGGPTKGGVFEHLPKLQVGSTIVIERGDGRKITYVIKENTTISLEDMNNGGMDKAAKSFSSGMQGLSLISCTGKWIPAQETYDHRVVVRAVEQ